MAEEAAAPEAPERVLDPLEQAKLLSPLLVVLASDLRLLVNRRVETVEIVDDQTSRRRVSVDFTVPRDSDIAATGHELLRVVPVALFARQALHNFDIKDEDGTALPVMTREESEAVVLHGLLGYARGILGADEELVDAVADDLKRIVTGTEAEALNVYRSMRGFQPRRASAEQRRELGQRLRLIRNTSMQRLLLLIARTFILFVQTDVPVGARRIFKFTFEHPTDTVEQNPIRWLLVRLGLLHSKLGFDAASAQQTRSYHIEIAAPPELEISQALLQAPGCPTAGAGGGIGRTHLNVSGASGPGVLVVSFRTRRAGFLRAALLTSVLTCALLFVGRTRLDNLASEVEAASTLLLIVPGLLAAYLSRPGEHALASALLVGVRAMVLVTGLCSIAAGLVLVAELSTEDRELWWAFLAYLSAGALILVALANLFPTRGRDRPSA